MTDPLLTASVNTGGIEVDLTDEQFNPIHVAVVIFHTVSSVAFWISIAYFSAKIKLERSENYEFSIQFFPVILSFLTSCIGWLFSGRKRIRLNNLPYHAVSSFFGFLLLSLLTYTSSPSYTRLDEQALFTFAPFIGYGIVSHMFKFDHLKRFDSVIVILIFLACLGTLIYDSQIHPDYYNSLYPVLYFFAHVFVGISSAIYELYWMKNDQTEYWVNMFTHSCGLLFWMFVSSFVTMGVKSISYSEVWMSVTDLCTSFNKDTDILLIFLIIISYTVYETTRVYIALRRRSILHIFMIFSSLTMTMYAYVTKNKLVESGHKITENRYITFIVIMLAIVHVLVLFKLLRISYRHGYERL